MIFFINIIGHSQISETYLPKDDKISNETNSNNPVDLFTGALNYNIPLWTIETDGLQVPLYLNYNTKGLKVANVASCVGLGWNLNVGGVITRIVNEQPDDYYETTNEGLTGYIPHNTTGWLDLDADDKSVAQTVSDFNEEMNLSNKQDLLLFFEMENLDTEPDVFIFNANGMTGKFVFDKNKSIRLIPYQNILIVPTFSPTTKEISKFTLTTPDGICYTFDNIEKSVAKTTSYNMGGGAFKYTQTRFTSSWLLTSIKAINGNIISYSYITENISYNQPVNLILTGGGVNPFEDKSKKDLQCTVESKRLTSIYNSNFKIDFLVDNSITREDVDGGKALSSIKIVSMPQNQSIKTINFKYEYFNGSLSRDEKRLKLTELKMADIVPPFVFSYNETDNIPSRLSCEADIWGYYNGNGATSLFPNIYVYPDLVGSSRFRVYPKSIYTVEPYIFNNIGGGSADRRSNETKMKANSLIGIKLPTGGSLTINYQSNDFFYDSETIVGGGLRVSSLIDHDGINHAKDKTIDYYYKDFSNQTKSSGRVFNMPVFAFLWYGPYIDNVNNINVDFNTIHKDFNSRDLFKYFMFVATDNLSNANSALGKDIGYKNVTVLINGQQKTEYEFSVPGAYGDLTDNDGLFSPNTTKIAYSTECPCTRYTDELDWGPNGAPYTLSPIYDWNRGLLISEKIYNGQFPLKESTYTYKLNNSVSEYVYGISYKGFMSVLPSECNIDALDFLNYCAKDFLYCRHAYITNRIKQLDTKTETLYGTNSAALSTTTKYLYNNIGQLSSISQTQSDGIKLTTNYKYPKDVVNENYMQSLILNNRINEPIQKDIIKIIGSTTLPIGAEKTKYKSENNLILPGELQNSNTDLSKLKPVIQFDKYDTKGNILYTYQQNGTKVFEHTCYLWAYNQSYPIAKIENSTYQNVENALTSIGAPITFLETKSIGVSDETDLIQIFNNLRINALMKDAIITSYTYDPLIGIRSETDPSGKTTYYEYDGLGRLILARDQNNNIVKSYDYHYKTE
jgi:YD repeat-containing protein